MSQKTSKTKEVTSSKKKICLKAYSKELISALKEADKNGGDGDRDYFNIWTSDGNGTGGSLDGDESCSKSASHGKSVNVNAVSADLFDEMLSRFRSASFRPLISSSEEEDDGEDATLSGPQNWVVGFRPLFNVLKKDAGLLYFYPGEVKGFIESCILGMQRPVGSEIRDMTMFRELYDAQKMWYDKMQEDMYIKGVSFYVGGKEINHSEFELREAVALAAYIDDLVQLYMTPIVEALKEPFAIDETSFKWTDAHALIFKTYSGKNHNSR